MKDLSEEEEQWLEVFAKYNPFFDDLLQFFFKNAYLSEKQYECLEKEIDRAAEDGNIILDKADFRFLKENAEENEDLRAILKNYEDDGFLDDFDFNTFINIKLELNPDFKKIKISKTKSERLSEVEGHDKQFTPYTFQKEYEEGTPNDNDVKEINLEKIVEFLNEEFLAKDPNSNYLTYILKLENNKWWIGKTKLILRTIEDFKRSKGNKWIIDNPIVSIEKLVFHTDAASLTLEYIKKYGRENVQGSSLYENLGNDKASEKAVVYILRLENNKWWIGKSKNPSTAIAKQKKGRGSVWTGENRVIEIKEIIENGDLTEVILRYMKNYGWENVRGTSFNNFYYVYIPKKIKEYIKSQEGGLEYFKKKEGQSGPQNVYILRLENGKWYVGKSSNVKRRVKMMKKKGNTWIQMHNIIALEEVRENADLKEVTLEYMRKYGWKNVRGYAWSQWNMKNPPKELRLK